MTGTNDSTKIEINVDENEQEKPNQEAADNEVKETEEVAEETEMSLEEKYEAAIEESKQSYDRFLRVSAEFENFKKRKQREMADFRKFANEALIQELLPTVDNLERALESAKQEEGAAETLIEGVDMILGETLKILEKFQVIPIEALNKPFDPSFHQAVFREETDQHPENTVVNEVQKGYLLHDRLLRPAMVVVSQPRKPAEKEEN